MRKLFTLLLSLFAAFALSAPALAQSYIPVVASSIQDAQGNLLQNGTWCAVPTDNLDRPILIKVGPTGVAGNALSRSVCATVANGAITGPLIGTGTYQLANPATAYPANIRYRVTITDTDSGLSWVYKNITVTANSGSNFAWDNYLYNGGSIPATNWAYGPQGPAGTNCASTSSPGTCVFNGTLIAANTSKLRLYSSSSCAVNSSVFSGGGTDDSACVQGLLNTINAAGGGTLVQDGASLISAVNVPGGSTGQTTALQIGPNTTLECTVGGGFYLANSSNVTMLGNAISGNPNSNLYQQRIRIDNCLFNENGANQSRYELGNSSNGWVYGLWFGGFNGLFINNVAVLNARTFAFLLTNGESFYGHDLVAVQTAGEGSGGNNHDGLHFDGTLQNVYVTNFVDDYGDDDALAFNTDEGVYNYNAGAAWQYARYPNSGGVISNVTIDGVQLVGVNDAMRWIGYSTTNGTAAVSNITLRNIYGTVNNFETACCGSGVTSYAGITIDGWNVTNSGGGGSVLYTPPGANPLAIDKVIPSVSVSIGTGSTAAVNPLLVANSYASAQTVSFTAGSAAGTSPTIGCYGGGFTCSPDYGIIGVTIGTSPPSNGNLVTLYWTVPFYHNAVCTFNGYDNAGSSFTNLTQNTSLGSTTSAVFYAPTGFVAGHSLAIIYHCW